VAEYLRGLARHLALRTYADPIVYAPAADAGRPENQGFDGFVPLIDSGIAAYLWTGERFFSVVVYSCKTFDEGAALDFTRRFFLATGEIAHRAF
jgi:S-adenosylmethionine decarboxylase